LRDEELKVDITRVHKENFDVYGAEKMWLQLNREGIPVGRDRVARLMPEVGLAGVVRGKVWRTTFPADIGRRPADLVDRKFIAVAPNRLWVADLTYVRAWACIAYTAFVTDVFSRYIVGWKISTSLRAELAMDALEMAIWARGSQDLSGLVHHSDRGQYLSIRYTERLADAGAVCSVGSRGDSYDNAMAESVNALYKTEVVRKQGPWRSNSSNWQPPAGSSGTTSGAFTVPSTTCRRRSSKRSTTVSWARRRRDSDDAGAPGRMPQDSGFERPSPRASQGVAFSPTPASPGFSTPIAAIGPSPLTGQAQVACPSEFLSAESLGNPGDS
jgi:putative transposase